MLINLIVLNKSISKSIFINLLNKNNILEAKKNILKDINNLENIIKKKNNLNNNFNLNDSEDEKFNENIKMKIIANQKHFCKSFGLFIDLQIENLIMKNRINFNNISFTLFIYKKNEIEIPCLMKKAKDNPLLMICKKSNTAAFNLGEIKEEIKLENINIKYNLLIQKHGAWEKKESINLLNSLNFYSKKKMLPNKNITILDIGANIGWYSFLLGKLGYEIISFEVSSINNYILKKNFCLNKDIDMTIINKGIGLEEEKCLLHHPSKNIGDAIILCGENVNIPRKNEDIIEEIKFTKLSNYIPFLKNKNLALIKIDIEGSEGKAINSGIELITKYHIPFIFLEFVPDYLKMQGTDPKEFLEIFEKNGYKISLDNFLSQKYLPIEQILQLSDINLYIVYSEFIEK